jgi:hypothetical protein
MLRFVLDHRKAINKFTANKDNDLRQLELSMEEWKVIRQLCDILEVCVHMQCVIPRSAYLIDLMIHNTTLFHSHFAQILKDATLFFSRSTPNLANVIPVMDIINDRLTTNANDATISPAIRAALGLAKKTLNHYYSKTDNSEAYRIAMGMFNNLLYIYNHH